MTSVAKDLRPQGPCPSSFRELIALWPRTRDFARDAGCSALLVRQWRHRNFVPPQYWPGIVAGAARRQIPAIDLDLLARLAVAMRGRGASSAPAAARKMPPVTPDQDGKVGAAR